ncbi:MAG: Protein containing Protein synthesis factor, GTP-binding domain protein, partial [Halanaerobium sp.]
MAVINDSIRPAAARPFLWIFYPDGYIKISKIFKGEEKKMAKAKFERTKPHVNIGTIGHVDHG